MIFTKYTKYISHLKHNILVNDITYYKIYFFVKHYSLPSISTISLTHCCIFKHMLVLFVTPTMAYPNAALRNAFQQKVCKKANASPTYMRTNDDIIYASRFMWPLVDILFQHMSVESGIYFCNCRIADVTYHRTDTPQQIFSIKPFI